MTAAGHLAALDQSCDFLIDGALSGAIAIQERTIQHGTTAMTNKATFGAGCFWGVEAAFRQIPGVIATTAGYEGGTLDNPSYEDVCSNTTGHAEVVEVEFDPAQVGYNALLDVFWNNHDPTTLNRQGPDVGTQYRSAIFYNDAEQKELAERSREIMSQSGRFQRPIVTEIAPATTFYRAEDYHQQYLEKRGLSSCHIG